MKVAKLPNGMRLQFSDSTADDEMDAAVHRYMLNVESTGAIVTIAGTLEKLVNKLNDVVISTAKQQTEILERFKDTADTMADAAEKLHIDKLQKSIDVMGKTTLLAITNLNTTVKTLKASIDKPIDFKHDASGKIIGAV